MIMMSQQMSCGCAHARLAPAARRRMTTQRRTTVQVLAGEAEQALDRHNMYRARHGAPPLVLDWNLSAGAQRWADRGVFEHSPNEERPDAGENLELGRDSVEGAVDDFYNEVSSYDFNNPDWQPSAGHFTQLVWRGSQRLGVGFGNINGQRFYVFRYSPAGNMIGSFQDNVFRANSGGGNGGGQGGEQGFDLWTIQPGDTFWDISQRLGVPLEAVTGLNPGQDPRTLQVGQVIKVPRRG